MTDDLQHIRRFVARLVWRERGVILARGALQLALLLLLVLWVVLLAPLLGWDRALATAALVGVAGVGLWAVVLPSILRWRPSGDALRQARLAESFEPGFRGRLVTSVERLGGPQGQESAALLGLMARRAVGLLAGVRPGKVHGMGRLLALCALVMVGWSLWLPATLLAPGGPSGVLRWWSAGLSASAAVSKAVADPEQASAQVGDLALHYIYPAYTGLDPRTVPNSTGDVRGPPGTVVKVSVRTGEVVEAAALVAYDEPALDAEVDDAGRSVSGSFVVQAEPGSYLLMLYRQGNPERSRSFSIEPEADLPPDVTLEAEADLLEVAVDQRIALGWHAKDDYGIASVRLLVDDAAAGKVLARPDQRQTELDGALGVRPAELGLRPGDRAELRIAAWDNDTVGGAKRGVSRVITVVVLGAAGLDARSTERQLALRDAMLDVLADFLEEPWPTGQRGVPTSGELVGWGEAVAARYGPLDELADSYWHGVLPSTIDAMAVAQVTEAGRALIRYTQVSFTPGSSRFASDNGLSVVAELRDTAITSLEDGILALDRTLRNATLADVAERAGELADSAERLDALLAQDDPNAQELLAQLDALERQLAQLARSASQLSEGGLKEFVNARTAESQSLMDEIRKAIAEGKMDEARQLMERLRDQLKSMAEGIEDNLRQAQQEGEDLMGQADDLKQQLAQLEKDQRALQADVAAAREQGDRKSSERMAELWRKIQQRAAGLQDRGALYHSGLVDNERPFNERVRVENAINQGRAIAQAAGVRDSRGAREGVARGQRAWNTVRSAWIAQSMRGSVPGPGSAEIRRIQADLDAIDALLDQLDQASRQVDPAVQERTQQLQQRQQAMEQEMAQAQQQAKELSQKFPVKPEGMKEAMDEASNRMGEASGDLGRGRPMEAEGSQGVAAERLREAQDAIERAMKQAAQQQQQLQKGGKSKPRPDGDPKGEGESGQQPMQEFSMPQPEEFLTPEAYRRALLEGMEGEVPDAYRALKKKYYDDLVRQ